MAKFQRPTGTRDLYPEDVLRRRYVLNAWRDASVRHGFEEIEGPTFEHLDLYTVKSGEGIVSELFSFRRSGGEKDYALRPEFTPTLARMYAEKAATLQKPTRWFTAGPYFRAERPQRGRLREFLQWNCDILGINVSVEKKDADDQSYIRDVAAAKGDLDSGILACLIGFLESLGLTSSQVRLHLSNRRLTHAILDDIGIDHDLHAEVFSLLDAKSKLTGEEFAWKAGEIGLGKEHIEAIESLIQESQNFGWGRALNEMLSGDSEDWHSEVDLHEFFDMLEKLRAMQLEDWWSVDFSIVRGLAYYTGMVFEVIAGGERAVAGGGRYDNLIEMFGGPPTPAVGFGMGDVVLSLLLQDKGLMPEGAALADAVSSKPASARPDVFVISADEEQGDPLVLPLLSALRRGVQRKGFGGKPWDADRYVVPPMHARTSDKSTRNLKKLLADAERQKARFAAIVHREEVVQLKDLDARKDLGDFHATPDLATDDRPFVGAEIAKRLGY
ncbi:MAG: ATP phosphoribosyltransferase regulatory subunit [Phycisphaerales bacterium]|nr:ATP phosphoribosyltransferase regulatory subunit [Phycisphaerales bacterium]